MAFPIYDYHEYSRYHDLCFVSLLPTVLYLC